MLHALIDSNNNIVRVENNIDPDVQTKVGFYWLPVIDVPRPEYNPNTHVARQTVTIGNEAVTRDWVIDEKTADELDADRIRKINAVDPVILAALLHAENGIRTLRSEPALSMDQYKDVLKGLI